MNIIFGVYERRKCYCLCKNNTGKDDDDLNSEEKSQQTLSTTTTTIHGAAYDVPVK